MKRILFVIAVIFFLKPNLLRADLQVIQVRRNIPLADHEPVYKDYYISGGTKMGLRNNLVVQALRWVNLRENNQSQDQAMKILEPVGWLKVIFTHDQLAVARLYESTDSEQGPILEQPGVMVGDTISLERSFLAKESVKSAKDSAHKVEKKEELEQKVAPPISSP